ncbi:Outer membrane protein assembly factor BamB, contains PQQ-like beta-propeller repeat [Streptomyces sp. Ncost-T6T-1]|uniref:outer membrane protein assembly factor BamB family protein n=1 Tax=Streptomyces sp. Ncost-T6T-1 TaxID=1100828 RepID=UPI0008058E09|nr:PQQ-binding-like beta-propeller repeat protein [Streptomyces sp. Ncost-T6T-1]SBU99522.1 Outer membrane protein assembly factor BamB, contains PQQ-like beta-propeller repeat [Streptomyces sp. Ncost-T6T-1]
MPPSPPQQGFGAPYEPQPGVYGDPGQLQPGPYGQPSQPSYGYPPQPPTAPYGRHQPQPPAPPSGGRSRGRVAGLVAAVLAGVLVVGAGVWFVAGGDGGSDDRKPVAKESAGPKQPGGEPRPKFTPAPGADELNKGRKEGEAKVRWVQKNGVDVPAGGGAVRGPWVAGDIVAKAMYRTMSGYSVEDGTRRWSLPLPADFCAAPTLPSADGKIVLALRADTTGGADCDRLQMIDLTTGKAGWTATLDRSGITDGLSHIAMAVNGDVVTVGRLTRTDAYRIGDGKHLWDRLPGSCQPYAFTSGDVPLAAVDCRKDPDEDGTPDQEVRRMDPATGRTVWTYKVKKGWRIDQFYSVDPPVVSLRKDEDTLEPGWAIVFLTADGTFRAQPVPGKENFAVRCGKEGENRDNCIGVATDDDTFYLTTEPASVGGEASNAVVAFDMRTGKIKWKVPAPYAQYLYPLRVEDGKVLLYLSPSLAGDGTRGGGIMALGPQGGALRPVLRHPASAAYAESGMYEPAVRYADGRSLITSTRVGADDDEEELDQQTMIAFGD